MNTNLGKRKRRTADAIEPDLEGTSAESESEVDAQELFRRHFEAKFKPLPVVKKVVKVVEEESEDDFEDGSDWDGISNEGESAVEVVEHTGAQTRMALMSKEELKTFMSSKISSSSQNTTTLPSKVSAVTEEDDASETANLKKDLELQRFLRESHLLEPSTDHAFSGKNRHKATDLRLQALGSKTSILKQEKMPMTHRKGMIAKQGEREVKRRKEARENGIILEKATMEKRKGGEGRRDRGVGAPGVGRFEGGTLKLSKKDIFDIEGPKKGIAGRGGRGGRGGGRGRGKRGR